MGELFNPYPRLPKNIRQAGDRDPIVKVYVEDYVNTYLKSLRPGAGQDIRVGLLLGNVEIHEGTPYIFIDGAMEMEDVLTDGEQVNFTEISWKKAYETIEQMFPKRTVQGWFLCGHQDAQLSPLNYQHPHGQYFPGKYQLMYLNSNLDGEESIYITSEEGFYQLRGHCIYYERNQMMQDYLVLRKDVQRVEMGVHDGVIRDFRERMADRKLTADSQRGQLTVLKGFCAVLSIIVLAGGITMVNNYKRMKEMESVLASVLPQKEAESSMVLVEQVPAGVAPETDSISQNSGLQSDNPLITALTEDAQSRNSGQSLDTPGQSNLESARTGVSENADASEGGQPAGEQANSPAGQAQESVQGANPSSEDKPSQEDSAESQAAEPVDTTSWKSYTIQDGETLFKICFERYGNVNQLDLIVQANHLESQDCIIAGQNLLLP